MPMQRATRILLCVAVVSMAATAHRATFTAQTPPPATNTEFGFATFQQRCLGCHGNPAVEKAPSPAQLRQMSPEAIYTSLTSGAMKVVVGDSLSDDDKRRVAESISGRLLGSETRGDASGMPNQCTSNPPLPDPASQSSWNGWSPDRGNSRFQPSAAAGLTAAQVPKLKLKWAFGFPAGSTSAYTQPTIVSGRVFVGSDIGHVYSLDAATGCVYWSYRAKASVRAAASVGPFAGRPGTPYAVYVGDLKANVYALDARTGQLLWEAKADDNFTTRVTAAPALHRGMLYVPISSWEEFSARTLEYPCCTSVGSVVAFDANTGSQVWKTYVIEERPKVVRKNAKGVDQWGPAGGSVWNSPTVDEERGALYFGTGDGTTFPPPDTIDAVMALDLKTGKRLWSYQVHNMDSFLVGCDPSGRTENCPEVQGPDWDIPSSPILQKLPNGKRLLIVGTKPGDVVALDPDNGGQVVWRTSVSGEPPIGVTSPYIRFPRGGGPPTTVGRGIGAGAADIGRPGLMWGGTADGEHVYFGVTTGGVAAMRLSDGRRVRMTRLRGATREPLNTSAPASAIPGVVFVGGSDGTVRAVSMTNGRVLWSFETARQFDTVNKVSARGGSINSVGASIADGMVFVPSGYAIIGNQVGNVLLAFGL
jgi:polyvinyl alcohol dehydrogenase (cytochrome)